MRKASYSLTWHHVVIVIAVLWLTSAFIVGEKLQVGSVELRGLGCSMGARDVNRDTAGLISQTKTAVK